MTGKGERKDRDTRMVRVHKVQAEELRTNLNAIRAVRKDREIEEEGGWVLIPIERWVTGERIRDLGGETVMRGGNARQTFRSPIERILCKVDADRDTLSLLPRKWEKLGEILIIKFPEELRHRRTELARVYAEVLGAKTVCDDVGGISGRFRRPLLDVVLGDDTETVHRENGILYEMDVRKVMFSSGNISERRRMGELDCGGETVVDMFAGIGYFTLPVAVHGQAERTIACEINPDAQYYLSRNLALNGVEDVVEVFKGDNRELPGSHFADRVIMGYVETEDFLSKGFDLVRDGGIVHYHNTCPVDMIDQAERRIREAAGERNIQSVSMREVKSYAPAISHYVWDIRFGPNRP